MVIWIGKSWETPEKTLDIGAVGAIEIPGAVSSEQTTRLMTPERMWNTWKTLVMADIEKWYTVDGP